MDISKNPWTIFYVYIFFNTCFFAVSSFIELPDDEVITVQVAEEPNEETPFIDESAAEKKDNLISSLIEPETMLFLITIALIGVVFQVIGSYLFIYLTQTWNASQTLLGTISLYLRYDHAIFCFCRTSLLLLCSMAVKAHGT